MGSDMSKYPLEQGLEPGTYRIINAEGRTAIQVSDYNPRDVVAWQTHQGANQQWFLQRSGDGYVFKNREHGSYLSVSRTEMHSRLHSNTFPTTWSLLKRGDYHLIQYPNTDLVLDLHFGLKENGNKIQLQPGDDMLCKAWKLQWLSGNAGETPYEYSEKDSTEQGGSTTLRLSKSFEFEYRVDL